MTPEAASRLTEIREEAYLKILQCVTKKAHDWVRQPPPVLPVLFCPIN
jgi:hypothetical protein